MALQAPTQCDQIGQFFTSWAATLRVKIGDAVVVATQTGLFGRLFRIICSLLFCLKLILEPLSLYF